MEISGNIIATVMLITAFIYPLFGKKSHYCTHVCPYGSLQQIAGRGMKYKIKMSPLAIKRLDKVRKLIWALLMICIWGGVWSEWTDYEPFSAFIFRSASCRTLQYYIPSELFRYGRNIRTFPVCAWQIL